MSGTEAPRHVWRVLFRIWRRTTMEDFRLRRELRDVRYEVRAHTAQQAAEAAWSRLEAEWPLRHWTGELLYLVRDDVTDEDLARDAP